LFKLFFFCFPVTICPGTDIDFSLKVSNRYNGRDYDVWHATMYCKKCHAYGKRAVCHSYEKYRPSEAEKEKFKQEAIKAWNTRNGVVVKGE